MQLLINIFISLWTFLRWTTKKIIKKIKNKIPVLKRKILKAFETGKIITIIVLVAIFYFIADFFYED